MFDRSIVPSTAQIVYVHSSLCLSRGQLWNLAMTKVCGARINYLKLSCCQHFFRGGGGDFDAIFSQDVSKEGR